LFVRALGASSYTFAIATLTQELPVWLDCHVRLFEFLGGATSLIICDNLRAGVTHPDRYETELNASYRELATEHRERRGEALHHFQPLARIGNRKVLPIENRF